MSTKLEDRKYRKDFVEDNKGTLSNIGTAFGYGAKSAWNYFNLEWRDFIKRSNEDLLAVEKIERFDKKPNEEKIEDFNTRIDYREEQMKPYIEAEMKNLREYQAFYDSIDNAPARFLTSLSYGGAKSFLNPIEVGKNIALNSMTLGGGAFVNFGFQVLLDTTDNLITNRYEDELLGKIREDNVQTLIEAGGGAVLGNTIFPAIKWGGRKIKGMVDTEIANVLNEDFIKINALDLQKIDVLDFQDIDPKVTFKNKKYFDEVKNIKPIENSFVVNLKQEIKNANNLLDTGYDSSTSVDFREMVNDIIKLGEDVTREALANKNQGMEKALKSGKNEFEASKSNPMDRLNINTALKRNTMELVRNYIEKPIELYELEYKKQYHKALREISTKYDDVVFNIGPLKKSVNERFAEDLEEYTVVDSVLDSVFTNTTKFASKENSGIDPLKLSKFGDDRIEKFRLSIGQAVTYNTQENVKLFMTNPKYEKYFTVGNDFSLIDGKIDNVIKDFINGDLNFGEFSKIIFFQKEKYDYLRDNKKLKEAFNEYIAEKIRKAPKPKVDGVEKKTEDFIDLDTFNPDKIAWILENITKRKTDIALMSLTFNKEELFDFFIRNKDFQLRKEKLGDKINLIKVGKGETQAQALDRFLEDILVTTNWKKALDNDLEDVGFAESISRDLIDVIKDNFKGKSTKDKMKNFTKFIEYWRNDNITMLNTMENMTTTAQASISALGVPFYRLKNALDEKEGFAQLFYDIPMLRKDYDVIMKSIAKERAIADTVQKSFMEVLGNYLNRKDTFKKIKQVDPVSMITDSGFWALRNYFLALSGIKEVFQHPVLVAGKGTEYFNNNFFKSGFETIKVIPRAYGLTLLRELKPLASANVQLNKLYRGLGTFIGGDDGELLATLEVARSMNIIAPRKKGNIAVEGIKGMADIIQDINLHIQGSMQNLRFVSSNLLAIQKIKELMNVDKFEDISLNDKDILKRFGINSDETFASWKEELSIENGLVKALYSNGYSDVTKHIRSNMAFDLYEEDPFKNLRDTNPNNNAFIKLRTLFSTFTNQLLNYGSDKIRYYKDNNGIYRNRFSLAYLKHIKDNPTQFTLGVGGSTTLLALLGMAGISGQYLDSKLFQKSDDEKIKAQLNAIINSENNKEYIKDFAFDNITSAIGINSLLNSSNGIDDMFLEMYENKFIPKRISSLYLGLQGYPQYSKPYKMDWYTRSLYQEEIRKDVNKRAGIEEEKQSLEDFFNALEVSYYEALEEDGQIPKGTALEKKRELLGYDDKKEVEDIKKSKNYEMLETISIAQSTPENVEINFMDNLNKAQEENLLNADEEKFLESFGIDREVALVLSNTYKLNEGEKKKLSEYIKGIDTKDEFSRMLEIMTYMSYLISQR